MKEKKLWYRVDGKDGDELVRPDEPYQATQFNLERVHFNAFQINEESRVAIGLNLQDAVDAILECKISEGEREEDSNVVALLDKNLHCHVLNISSRRVYVLAGKATESEVQGSFFHEGVRINPIEIGIAPKKRTRLNGRRNRDVSSVIFDLSGVCDLSVAGLREGRQQVCLNVTINDKPEVLYAFPVLGDTEK
jgi:hypothetical protein